MAHPHKDTRLAKFISKRIDELKGVKSQAEIAAQAGFTNAKAVSANRVGARA